MVLLAGGCSPHPQPVLRRGAWHRRSDLSGPKLRDTAILSLRYSISRDTFPGRSALPPKWCDTPPWYLVSHRHISAIPHLATYRAIPVRYPIKTSTKSFCDTIATSIARYEKYRCWVSKAVIKHALKSFEHANMIAAVKLMEGSDEDWISPHQGHRKQSNRFPFMYSEWAKGRELQDISSCSGACTSVLWLHWQLLRLRAGKN